MSTYPGTLVHSMSKRYLAICLEVKTYSHNLLRDRNLKWIPSALLQTLLFTLHVRKTSLL